MRDAHNELSCTEAFLIPPMIASLVPDTQTYVDRTLTLNRKGTSDQRTHLLPPLPPALQRRMPPVGALGGRPSSPLSCLTPAVGVAAADTARTNCNTARMPVGT